MNGTRITSMILVGILIAAAVVGSTAILSRAGPGERLSPATSQPQQSITTTSSSPSPSSSAKSGTISVSLTDPPNVPANVTDIYMSYSGVEVHISGVQNDSWGWYQVADAGSVDLMQLINVSVPLGGGSVDPGTFDLIAFDIQQAIITYSGQNYTAYVPDDQISVPIGDGGIVVNDSGVSSVLIDLYPTVIPYQSGNSLGFVLVPAASALPIPPLDQSSPPPPPEGNITIPSAQLSNESMSVVVQNVGTNNVTLSEIDVLQTQNGDNDYDDTPQNYTIASFYVLDNGSLLAPTDANQALMDSGNVSTGFVLAPNSTATFSFSGPIAQVNGTSVVGESSNSTTTFFSFTDSSTESGSEITSGQPYYIVVYGDIASAEYNVTAS